MTKDFNVMLILFLNLFPGHRSKVTGPELRLIGLNTGGFKKFRPKRKLVCGGNQKSLRCCLNSLRLRGAILTEDMLGGHPAQDDVRQNLKVNDINITVAVEIEPDRNRKVQ